MDSTSSRTQLHIGNGTGNPRVSEPLPIPLPGDPYPQPDGFTCQFSAKTVENWLKIGPLGRSRVSRPLPISVPAVTRTANPQGLKNPCHSIIADRQWPIF